MSQLWITNKWYHAFYDFKVTTQDCPILIGGFLITSWLAPCTLRDSKVTECWDTLTDLGIDRNPTIIIRSMRVKTCSKLNILDEPMEQDSFPSANLKWCNM